MIAFLDATSRDAGLVRHSSATDPAAGDIGHEDREDPSEEWVRRSGSITLVRAMLADGLVDELHLFVYALTRGSGPRLFPEDAAPRQLSRAACEPYENGVVYLAYRPQA
jgi:dihydrofolate reductase